MGQSCVSSLAIGGLFLGICALLWPSCQQDRRDLQGPRHRTQRRLLLATFWAPLGVYLGGLLVCGLIEPQVRWIVGTEIAGLISLALLVFAEGAHARAVTRAAHNQQAN